MIEFDDVKKEVDAQMAPNDGKAVTEALPHKLDGQANLTTVRKLIEKMTLEGFVTPSSNRRKGKRVIHSDFTKTMLIEVKKLLDRDAIAMDRYMNERSNHPEPESIGNKHKDLSTCGGLHSVGSETTRTSGKSDIYMNNSARSEHDLARMKEDGGNTPSRAALNLQPAASRESFVPGIDDVRTT